MRGEFHQFVRCLFRFGRQAPIGDQREQPRQTRTSSPPVAQRAQDLWFEVDGPARLALGRGPGGLRRSARSSCSSTTTCSSGCPPVLFWLTLALIVVRLRLDAPDQPPPVRGARGTQPQCAQRPGDRARQPPAARDRTSGPRPSSAGRSPRPAALRPRRAARPTTINSATAPATSSCAGSPRRWSSRRRRSAARPTGSTTAAWPCWSRRRPPDRRDRPRPPPRASTTRAGTC